MGGLAIAITEDLCIVSVVQIKSQLGTGLFISFVNMRFHPFVYLLFESWPHNGLIKRVELFGNSRDPLCPKPPLCSLKLIPEMITSTFFKKDLSQCLVMVIQAYFLSLSPTRDWKHVLEEVFLLESKLMEPHCKLQYW